MKKSYSDKIHWTEDNYNDDNIEKRKYRDYPQEYVRGLMEWELGLQTKKRNNGIKKESSRIK